MLFSKVKHSTRQGRSITMSEVREVCSKLLRGRYLEQQVPHNLYDYLFLIYYKKFFFLEQLEQLTADLRGPRGPPGYGKQGRPGPAGVQGIPGKTTVIYCWLFLFF